LEVVGIAGLPAFRGRTHLLPQALLALGLPSSVILVDSGAANGAHRHISDLFKARRRNPSLAGGLKKISFSLASNAATDCLAGPHNPRKFEPCHYHNAAMPDYSPFILPYSLIATE